MKNFDEWNKVKKKIEHRSYIPLEVEVGQVYWFSFGLNVGKEIGGKNNSFRTYANTTLLVTILCNSFFCSYQDLLV